MLTSLWGLIIPENLTGSFFFIRRLKQGGSFTPVKEHSICVAGCYIPYYVRQDCDDGTRVGLSFGTSSEIPAKFNITQPKSFNTTLFLNIDYIGNESSKSNIKKSKNLNLSSTESFFSSPKGTLQVSKSLNAEKLNDGCPKIKAGVFNDITRKWQPLNVTRNSTTDSESTCGYQLLIGHFSKFAVGDVVPLARFRFHSKAFG